MATATKELTLSGDAAKPIAEPQTSIAVADATGAPAVPASIAENETATLLDVIRRASTDPAVDVEKMERLMAMHERLMMRQAEAHFNEAMTAAQTEVRPIAADASNPQTKSKYASYLALDRSLRPIYTKHGFSLSFDTSDSPAPDHVRILCYVGHKSGHTRTYRCDMPADGKGAKGGDVMTKTHAAGAAFTYGQRYLMKMIFNIAVGEDNDGNTKGDGNTKINAEQKERLIALMKETNTDTIRFLKYMGVETLDDLTSKQFPDAYAALIKKARKV